MNKKGVLVSVTEKVKQDGSGSYYLVKVNDASTSKELPQHLCFDKKILNIKAGEKFDFISSEKNDRYFMNFPKEARTGYGSRKTEEYAKVNALLSTFTMPMSYAKDITCALIAKIDVTPEQSCDICLSLYRKIRKEIVDNKSLQEAIGVKPDTDTLSSKKSDVEGDLQRNTAKAVIDYKRALKSLGWIVPDEVFTSMIERLSGKKAEDGHLILGKKTVEEMDHDELIQFKERFLQFMQSDCVGDPKECKYYKKYKSQKTNGSPDHFCAWTTRCLYVENSTGKNI